MKMKSTANAFADSLVRQGASKETVCSYCKSVELFYLVHFSFRFSIVNSFINCT